MTQSPRTYIERNLHVSSDVDLASLANREFGKATKLWKAADVAKIRASVGAKGRQRRHSGQFNHTDVGQSVTSGEREANAKSREGSAMLLAALRLHHPHTWGRPA